MKRAHSCYSPRNPRRDTSEERKKLRSSHPGILLTVVFISLRKYCSAEGTSIEGTLSAGGVSTGEDLLREQEASSNPILK